MITGVRPLSSNDIFVAKHMQEQQSKRAIYNQQLMEGRPHRLHCLCEAARKSNIAVCILELAYFFL